MQTVLATAGLLPALGGALPDAAFSPRQTPEPKAGSRRAFTADEEIFAEGDRVAFFYKVASGAIRTYKLLSDGRRQIDAFHLPGDIFGVEAGEEHRFSAEAVTDTKLIIYRASDRSTLAGDGGCLAREVVGALLRGLERAQDHMMLLGRKSAKERIASFLIGLSERMTGEESINLPMSRADIADHLGLTIESVSRSLTQLEREGVIALPTNRRSVILRNPAALRRLVA